MTVISNIVYFESTHSNLFSTHPVIVKSIFCHAQLLYAIGFTKLLGDTHKHLSIKKIKPRTKHKYNKMPLAIVSRLFVFQRRLEKHECHSDGK